jgi:hypothetical protein
LRWSADSSPFGTGVAHAGPYSFLDKRPFELSHRAYYLEHQPARRSREIEIVAKTHEIHAERIQFSEGLTRLRRDRLNRIELPNQNYFETTSVRIDE